MESEHCRPMFMSLFDTSRWLHEEGTVRVVNLLAEQELKKVEGATGGKSTSLEALAENYSLPVGIREEAGRLEAAIRAESQPRENINAFTSAERAERGIPPDKRFYGLGHSQTDFVSKLNDFYRRAEIEMLETAFTTYLKCACPR